MTSQDNSTLQPPCAFPVHYGAAVLAAGGALVLQFAWPTILNRPPAASWWPLDACVLIAATGYLLTTTWMHHSAARRPTVKSPPGLWRLARAPVADVVVALVALAIFIRSPEAAALRAGLWLVAPILLTVAAASAVVGAVALRRGFRRLDSHAAPADATTGPPRLDLARIALALLLAASLVALEWFEPQVKPWEIGGTREASGTEY